MYKRDEKFHRSIKRKSVCLKKDENNPSDCWSVAIVCMKKDEKRSI
jgi:hypothetical protein